MKPGEKGFTLIEVVMVIAITALIAGAAATVTFQVVKGTERSNDHMTAVNQVQNAGYWISRDTQMAESVNATATPPDFLILSWVEEESGDQYQVIYTLEAMLGSELKKLHRHLSINGEPDDTTLAAGYIDPDPGRTKCELLDGRLVLTVTANVSTHSQTGVYEVVPRPN